jgi:hypothetical protein
MVASVSRGAIGRLPQQLRIAQEAIELPEVQEMLQKLSRYNLGIYLPHMHDEKTGAFEPLPDGITQVEEGLKVSFKSEEECTDSYVPVGWFWRAGISSFCRATCSARCVSRGTEHTSGHDTKHTES